MRAKSLLAVVAVMIGCGADDVLNGDDDRSPGDETARDAGAPVPPGSAAPVATQRSRTAIGAVRPRCDFGPPIAASMCVADDSLEPNTTAAPRELQLEDGCLAISSSVDELDLEDGFRFTTSRGDPLRVALEYTATSPQVDLWFDVRGTTGATLASGLAQRTGAAEIESTLLQASAGGIYTLNLDANRAEQCQPYRLTFDGRFCTDTLEDDDDKASATPLDLATYAAYDITGSISARDDDVYRFASPRRDPVLLELAYTAAVEDKVDVRLEVTGPTGATALVESGTRATAEERVTRWLQPSEPGAVHLLTLSALGSGCAPYKLSINADACTDAFEDNDTTQTAVKLAKTTVVDARVSFRDDDYYDLSEFDGARCTATFEPDPTKQGTFTLTAYEATGAYVTQERAPNGSAPTISLDLTGKKILKVEASDATGCVPYRLRCQPR